MNPVGSAFYDLITSSEGRTSGGACKQLFTGISLVESPSHCCTATRMSWRGAEAVCPAARNHQPPGPGPGERARSPLPFPSTNRPGNGLTLLTTLLWLALPGKEEHDRHRNSLPRTAAKKKHPNNFRTAWSSCERN